MEKYLYVFRALRKDEIPENPQDLLNFGLRARCSPCPDGPNNCCELSQSAHVGAGSRAKVKSRWISATMDPNIAALWSCRKPTESNPMGGMMCGFLIDPNDPNVRVLSRETPYGLTGTALGFAISSKEILIRDQVFPKYMISVYQSIQTNKSIISNPSFQNVIRDFFHGWTFEGKRMKKSLTLYYGYTQLVAKNLPDPSPWTIQLPVSEQALQTQHRKIKKESTNTIRATMTITTSTRKK